MKTMNITLFTIAFAVAMVLAGSNMRAGITPPSVLQCAKWMVYEMRNCSQEQPGTARKTDAKVGQPTASKAVMKESDKGVDKAANTAKATEQVQVVPAETCDAIAYWNYLSCVENGLDRVSPLGGKKTDDTPSVKAPSNTK
ncbi:MAG: hypothetical protein HYX66_09140 [Ignavibacteria bacterium]|nr:hypothetical protein [Ignavibacteria bacterium]